jgi:hypothetical protein
VLATTAKLKKTEFLHHFLRLLVEKYREKVAAKGEPVFVKNIENVARLVETAFDHIQCSLLLSARNNTVLFCAIALGRKRELPPRLANK